MNHSDLILADEPTGNLDSASSETVMEYLQMINKDLKKAVVLVTHDAYVASFCNRVIFVKDGMIEVELKKTEGGLILWTKTIVGYLLSEFDSILEGNAAWKKEHGIK